MNSSNLPAFVSLRFILTAIAVGFLSCAAAANVPVTNTNDSNAGSLRQAIFDAVSGDTIVFQIPTTAPGYDPNTGIYTIGLTSGELAINKDLTIDGGGQKIAIRRAPFNPFVFFRIFEIITGTVTIDRLSLEQGYVSDDNGGGIANRGNLTVRNCTFAGNSAQPSGGSAFGGAIFNGGGTGSPMLRVSNCTFSGNTAGAGGAIYNAATGTLAIDNSTISSNTTTFAAALDNTAGGTARVRNTIVALNTSMAGSRDVAGAFISEGYNLIGTGTGSTGFGATGDQIGVSAAQASLTPLRDNGGPTQTIRPFPDSVAIDQGNRGLDPDNQPINTDQRGFARPIDLPLVINASGGDASDIGAVETAPLQDTETLTVTNTDSHHDGYCTTDDCTLREAIFTANSNTDANTIEFAPSVTGVISNGFPGPGFSILAPVSIVGPGARLLTINALNTARIFTIQANGVSITGLTLTDGRVSADGGAVHNSGTDLTLADCTISNSRAVLTSGTFGNGGGLYNASGASVNLARCTFSGNTAEQFGGGAIFNAGQVAALNCTFYGNTAPAGGAILSLSNNITTLRNCTITNNTATETSASTSGGGGYYGQGAFGNSLHHFANTILAGNINSRNPDIRGYGTSEGHNLVGNLGQGGSGFTNGVNGDLVGVDPKLSPFGLENNGGPTDTWALRATSPARDAGDDTLAPTADQRGNPRVGVSDIGAFELGEIQPAARAIERVGNDAVISFDNAIKGSVYRLERKFDLNALWPSKMMPPVAEFPDIVADANGPFIIVHPDAFAQAPRIFYRVILVE